MEAKVSSPRGRRFFGAYDTLEREYRACVEMVQGDDPVSQQLESWTIPGGKYAKKEVEDWQSKVEELPKTFDEMASHRKVDPTRPSVEFYRSERELILYLPVND